MPLAESTRLRLRTQLDCLPLLLAGASEDAMERRPQPEKWSARENLAHLARYQSVFLGRLHRMGTEDAPFLPRYKAEEDSEWPEWMTRSEKKLCEILRTQRRELVDAVEKLSDGDLKRIGTHARFGPMTIAQWLEFFLLHEAHHLLTVMQRVREPESEAVR